MEARTAIIYGDSGDTKTTQLFHMAKWYHTNYPDRKIRLITADGGGAAPFIDYGFVKDGVVDVYNIITEPKSYATLMMLSEGYWPRRLKRRGRVIEPSEEFRNRTFDGTGGMLLIEGLTAISTLWAGHLAHSDNPGFKHSWKFIEELGGKGYEVGGLQEGHYGMMQTELYKLVCKGFNALPFDYVLWTARVHKGENRQGETEYGPKGAGNKLTTEYPAWFMECIHLATETIEGKVKKVAWFQNHYDDKTGIKYLAKTRLLPHLLPGLYDKWDNGYVPLGFKRGLDVLYEKMEALTVEDRQSRESSTTTTTTTN